MLLPVVTISGTFPFSQICRSRPCPSFRGPPGERSRPPESATSSSQELLTTQPSADSPSIYEFCAGGNGPFRNLRPPYTARGNSALQR